MTDRPRGTVTFLFTDIEGSTRRWERDPTAMQATLRRHDAILRETIAAHGGYVFKTGATLSMPPLRAPRRPSPPPWPRSGPSWPKTGGRVGRCTCGADGLAHRHA